MNKLRILALALVTTGISLPIANAANEPTISATPSGKSILAHCPDVVAGLKGLVAGNGKITAGSIADLQELLVASGYPENLAKVIQSRLVAIYQSTTHSGIRSFIEEPSLGELLVCGVNADCHFAPEVNSGDSSLKFVQGIGTFENLSLINPREFRSRPKTASVTSTSANPRISGVHSLSFRLPPNPSDFSSQPEFLDEASQWLGQFFREGATYASQKLLERWVASNLKLISEGSAPDALFSKYVHVGTDSVEIDEAFYLVFIHTQASDAWAEARKVYYKIELREHGDLATKVGQAAESGHRSGTYKDLLAKIGDATIVNQEFGLSPQNIFERGREIRRQLEESVAGVERSEVARLIAAVSLNGRSGYSNALISAIQTQAPNNNLVGAELYLRATPAQALALYALRNDPVARNPQLFQAKLKRLIELSGGAESFNHEMGMSVEDYQKLIHRISETPGLKEKIKEADAIFRLLLPDSNFYSEFAHHPFLLPYVYAKFISPDAEIAETAAHSFTTNPALAGLEPLLEASLRAHPDLAKRIETFLVGAPKQGTAQNVRSVSLEKVFAGYKVTEDKNAAYVARIREIVPSDIAEIFFKSKEAQGALSLFIMGADTQAAALINGMALPSREVRQRLGSAIVAMSKDQPLQRVYAELTAPQLIPRLFFNAAQYNETIPRYGIDYPLLNFRTTQLMAAQIVAQYAPSMAGSGQSDFNILEIGYGVPSVLAALQPLYRGQAIGVDTLPIIEKPLPPRIEMIQGNAPSDAEARNAVNSKGPYRVVYAIDTVKPNGTLGESFRPNVSSAEYLNWVYSNLEDGGTFVIVNNADGKPTFTVEEARAAGFNIIRWGVQRRMNAMEIELNQGAPGFSDHLSYYVLRKGEFNAALSARVK